MSEPQWKAVQRKIARAWGFETGAHRGEPGSDGRGEGPVALEVKRTKGGCVRTSHVIQARAQGKSEGLPFVLVVCDHGDRDPIAVVSHRWLLGLAREAGVIA